MVKDGRHPFTPSTADPLACVRCPLPEANEIHHLPEPDDETRAAELRRLGEREL